MSSGSHSGPIFQSMPDPHGHLGQVGPRLGRPARSSTRVTRRARCIVGQTSRTPKGTEDGIKVNLPPKVDHPGRAAQRRQDVVVQRRPGLGRRQARPATSPVPAGDRRAVLDVEQLRHRGGLGLRLRRGLHRRRHHLDRAEGLRRGGALVSTADGYADPNGRTGRLRRQEVRPHRRHRRLAARLRRPRRRSPARPSSCACATPPTRPSRSAAGSSTTSRVTNGGADRLERRRRERRQRLDGRPCGTFTDTTGAGWVVDTGTSGVARTTWPSGATSTGSTRACSTPTTPTTRARARGRSRRSSTTPRACSSGTATRPTATTTTVADNLDCPAEHRLQGRPAPRRLPLRPAATDRRGGRQGPDAR